MKKILTAIVLFVFVALPMSVMAMQTISDSDLSAVTGQAGVSIGADITMDISATTLAWGDSDGYTGAANPGWVGLASLDIKTLRMHLRSDSGLIGDAAGLAAAYAIYTSAFTGADTFSAFTQNVITLGTNATVAEQAAALAGILTRNQFLTIDVGSASTTAGTAVRIGLPTFEIDMAEMTADVNLYAGTSAAPSGAQKLGSIYVGTMVALMGRDNYVTIAKNTTSSGVLITVGNATPGNNMFDSVTIGAMSWGDSDGAVTNTSAAGFIGLKNFTATGIKVAATLDINVASAYADTNVTNLITWAVTNNTVAFLTWEAGVTALLDAGDPQLKNTIGYLIHNYAGTTGTTDVDIALTFDVTVGSMVATAKFGLDKQLTAAALDTLGQIYVNNLRVHSTAPSWVTISAH